MLFPKNNANVPTFVLVSIILFVGLSRYLPIEYPLLFNFSPVIAIFLFCGAWLKGYLSWTVPITTVFITDLLLNPSYGKDLLEPFMLTTLASYFLVWLLGKNIGNGSSLKVWFGGAILSALFFHIITCTFAWIINPAYLKTVPGLFQAIIFGEPGFAPSYLFLRNTLLSTVFFSLAFRWAYLCLNKFCMNTQTNLSLSPKI